MTIVRHPPLRLQRARARTRRRRGGLILLLAAVALIAAPMVLQVTR